MIGEVMNERYSTTITELFFDPKNRGSLENPSGVGVSGTPGAGPFMVFQIISEGGQVTDARFQCHNCGVTVASGSRLTELVIGKKLTECLAIDTKLLSEALDGVPPDKAHSLVFALSAMHQAIQEASECHK